MSESRATPDPKRLALDALTANQEHQYALASHAESLSAHLAELDKLLAQADTEDGESDLECDFYIPEGKPPVGPIRNFNSANSPFNEDTMKRTRYLNFTVRHTMSAKEVEALKGAVNAETKRVEQLQGGSSSTPMTDKLDWAVIAEKVSDTANVKRTAEECKIKWLSETSSSVNRGTWDAPEVAKLRKIIGKKGKGAVDWVQVSEELGTNRLPLDCMRMGSERPRQVWSKEADRKLLDAVKMYGTAWSLVARYVAPDLTAHQCSVRYLRSLDPSLRHGTWSAEEDERLVAAVAGYGKSWVEVASVIPGRTGDQCRDRWTGNFDPSKAGRKNAVWSEEEEKKLVQAVKQMGRKWKVIAAQMGRSMTVCRKHYNKLDQENDSEEESPLSGVSTPRSREADDDTAGPSGRSTPGPTTTSRTQKRQPQAVSEAPAEPRPRPKPLGRGKKRKPADEDEGPRKKRAIEDDEPSERDDTATDKNAESPTPAKGKRRSPQDSDAPRRRSARLNPVSK